jgi:hypothetical protein
METSPLFKELISEEYRNEMLKLIKELDLHLIYFNNQPRKKSRGFGMGM